MSAYRVRVLLEHYDKDTTEGLANIYANEVVDLLTTALPDAKVFVYVEANPPEDEVEEYE